MANDSKLLQINEEKTVSISDNMSSEIQNSIKELKKKMSDDSSEEEEKHNEIRPINPNASNVTEFFCRSFKPVIEKIEEEEADKLLIQSSTRLRRTTSKFGASEIFRNIKPKIHRKQESVNNFFKNLTMFYF